ncbi:MAG: LEA type 2 family protein [Tannerellaceae bacterium]|nr:LEA type 2 family protein [Tannerellaceae bacterium]
MKRNFLLLLLSAILFQGCNVAKQVGEAYNLTQCTYNYNSVSHLTLAGIDLSHGVGLTAVPQVISFLTGSRSSVPLNLTINLDVTNPNAATAALQGLDYILKIDNIEFTRGAVSQALNVPSGSTRILPVSIGVDLASLLSGDSGNAVQNIVKNLAGISSDKSTVSLQIKPSFRIGNRTVPSPQYIPISFSFGGK